MRPSPTDRSKIAAAGTIGTCARSELEADSSLFEVSHHAGCRIQAERASTGQHDRVRDLDEVDGIQEVGLAGGRRRAAHVHAGRGAGFGEHHRAAGRTAPSACDGRP